MKPILEIRGLHFSYPLYSETAGPPVPLFTEIDLLMQEGEFIVVAGAPESGKTTLSRILCGLIPRYSGGDYRGTVRIAGQDLAEMKPQDLLTMTGASFQNPDEQFLTTRVDSEIAFPLESLCLPQTEIEQRVRQALDDFELTEMADRNPATLSGGEKKRLLCAVLAAVNPPLWILDETLDEIDPRWKKRIIAYLREKKTAVLIFSSKMADEYRDYGARICVLSRGRIEVAPENVQAAAEQDGLILQAEAAGEISSPPAASFASAAQPAEYRFRPARKTAAHPLLSVSDLEYSYPDSTGFRLKVEDFELYPGEVSTLAGPNGCGKTTMAKLLCGLYSPDKGRISLNGTEGRPAAIPTQLRTSVAYVFQNPDYQIFLPTVQEELAYGLKEKGMKPKEIETRIGEAIRLFRQPAPDTPPSLMSYGTRKRLQAAVYWLLERPIAILDEADSGLSFKDFAEIIHLFKKSSRALLIITHNEAVARQFSDRIILMKEGRIVREESETFFSGGGEE